MSPRYPQSSPSTPAQSASTPASRSSSRPSAPRVTSRKNPRRDLPPSAQISGGPMTTQVRLPRFSDPRDIEEFVQKLEEFEGGKIGPEQFRAFRLTRGVYGQRQADTQMLRVKVPMGR